MSGKTSNLFEQLTRISGLGRWSILFLLSACLLWTGFKREKRLIIIEQGIPTFINRYPKPAVAVFERTQMKGTLGIKFPAKLQSAVLYSVLFMVLTALLLMTYLKSLFIGKFVVVFYFAYMVICMALLKLGNLGVDYRLSTGLSHYLEDLFLSPFLILAFAAFAKAFDKMKLNANS